MRQRDRPGLRAIWFLEAFVVVALVAMLVGGGPDDLDDWIAASVLAAVGIGFGGIAAIIAHDRPTIFVDADVIRLDGYSENAERPTITSEQGRGVEFVIVEPLDDHVDHRLMLVGSDGATIPLVAFGRAEVDRACRSADWEVAPALNHPVPVGGAADSLPPPSVPGEVVVHEATRQRRLNAWFPAVTFVVLAGVVIGANGPPSADEWWPATLLATLIIVAIAFGVHSMLSRTTLHVSYDRIRSEAAPGPRRTLELLRSDTERLVLQRRTVGSSTHRVATVTLTNILGHPAIQIGNYDVGEVERACVATGWHLERST